MEQKIEKKKRLMVRLTVKWNTDFNISNYNVYWKC